MNRSCSSPFRRRCQAARSAATSVAFALAAFAVTAHAFSELEPNPIGAPNPIPSSLAPFDEAFPHGVVRIEGTLDPLDADAFSFELSAGTLLTVALFAADGGEFSDTSIGVFFDTNPTPIATNDDGGAGLLSRLGVPISQTGTHSVVVTGFGDSAFDGSHQQAQDAPIPYQLVVSISKLTPQIAESDLIGQPRNDTLAEADFVPPDGAVVHGTIEPGDVDHFFLPLEEGDPATVSLFDLQPGSFDVAGGELNDTVAAVFDPTGTLFGTVHDDSGPGLMSNLSFVVPPGLAGDWTVAVSSFPDQALTGSHSADLFAYELIVASDRDCLDVTRVIDGIVPPTGAFGEYAVADLLVGHHYFTDRRIPGSHLLVSIPPALECAQWIKSPNDDKVKTAEDYLQFTINQPAIVYVDHDDRATVRPAWITDEFRDTGDFIDITELGNQMGFNVFRKTFPTGVVSLGGNRAPPGDGTAGSNYIVTVRPFSGNSSAELFGVAAGGVVQATVDGLTVSVTTTPGQTAAEIVEALAKAIRFEPGISTPVLADGSVLSSAGTIDYLTVADDGLSDGTPIPALDAWGASALAMLLLLGAGVLAARDGAIRSAPPRAGT